MAVRTGVTIGEFAALTQLSVRTLRRYHEGGLLEPAAVDPHSGYRYYTAEQIPTAQVIHRLRQLDVPLSGVKSILATADPQRRADLITEHLERLENQLDRTRAAVVALRQLLRPEAPDLQVELRSQPARNVAAISATVRRDDVHDWYATAMTELDAAYPPPERTGPPGGRYANELFTHDAGAVLVYHQVHDPTPTGRIEAVDLPAVELAVTVHHGPHDAIAETYGRLGTWVVDHALAVDGPIHERYLTGPRDTLTDQDWRTEIGWPIFRVAAT